MKIVTFLSFFTGLVFEFLRFFTFDNVFLLNYVFSCYDFWNLSFFHVSKSLLSSNFYILWYEFLNYTFFHLSKLFLFCILVFYFHRMSF